MSWNQSTECLPIKVPPDVKLKCNQPLFWQWSSVCKGMLITLKCGETFIPKLFSRDGIVLVCKCMRTGLGGCGETVKLHLLIYFVTAPTHWYVNIIKSFRIIHKCQRCCCASAKGISLTHDSNHLWNAIKSSAIGCLEDRTQPDWTSYIMLRHLLHLELIKKMHLCKMHSPTTSPFFLGFRYICITWHHRRPQVCESPRTVPLLFTSGSFPSSFM